MMMIIMMMMMIIDHIYIYILKVHRHGIFKNTQRFRDSGAEQRQGCAEHV